MNQNPESSSPQNPPALFSNFVMSLASATLVELGLVPDPITNEKRKSFDHARQNIEILSMLKAKTVGNLSADESTLIDRVLTDLRLQFSKSKIEGA
jgi:hypothetical protein